MNAHEYISAQQVQWARNHDITLTGSKGKHGRRAYTPELTHNLFEPIEPEIRE